MGKKARLKKRLAEAKNAKELLEQINALDAEIAANTADLITLEGQKGQMLANMLIENQPPGRRATTLSDLLNDSQIQAVIDILNRPNLDDIAVTKLLKQYLAQFSQQLSAVGADANYMAYFLLA